MAIVEEKVKPERDDDRTREARSERLVAVRRDRARSSIAPSPGSSGCSSISQRQPARSRSRFCQPSMVFAQALIVFPLDTYAAFCVLQSAPHEIWARFFGSSLKDDLRYTPSDCFETFPFPEDWETHPDARGRRQGLLRVPRRADGRERRGPDQDLQPLPRSRRARPGHPEAPRAARRDGPRRARRLRLERHPDRLRVPPRLRDRRGGVGATGRSRGATAGPTRSATRCSRGCSS